MALTAEQQAELDFNEAREAGRRAHEQQMEAMRHANNLALEARRVKLEAIRLAKETLIENARSKPVDSRDVSTADVQAFAQSLVSYING